MGPWMTGALVVGTMIGAGIFLLPKSLAPLGSSALVGWFVSGLGATAIAYALALVTRHGSGGIQAYIERSFGPTIGYLVTWALWCSNWAASATLAIATASALAWLWPAIGDGAAFIALAIASVVVLQLVNARGAHTSGEIQVITTVIKILPLAAVLVAVFRAGADHKMQPLASAPLSIGNIGTAVALTLFALTGFENATAPVDKIRNPSRTLPLAILGGTAFVAMLYLLASYAVLHLLPVAGILASSAPFADAVGLRWGTWAAVAAAYGVAVAAFGSLNGMILGTGELAYSMALRGDFPRLFARTHRHHTPVAAQVLGSAFVIGLILANASKDTVSLFNFVLLLSTASVLFLYLAGALAAWKENPTPRARAIVVIAIGFIAFAFWGAGFWADFWGIALLAAGYVLRLVMRRINSRVLTSPAPALAPAAPLE
jgi:APA family basic amino acid/polyamine antiporter